MLLDATTVVSMKVKLWMTARASMKLLRLRTAPKTWLTASLSIKPVPIAVRRQR